MSDILIKGMELPKGNDYLHLIIQNGKVHKAISCGHLTTDELNVAEAVELPDSSWHTGIPTEEGWYLYEYGITGGSYATYRADTKKELAYLGEAKRWQKINLYKEKK